MYVLKRVLFSQEKKLLFAGIILVQSILYIKFVYNYILMTAAKIHTNLI